MNDKRDFEELGRKIDRGLRSVVNPRNLETIKSTIDDVVKVVTKNNPRAPQYGPGAYPPPQAPPPSGQPPEAAPQSRPAPVRTPAKEGPSFSIGGILLAVFGFVGLGVFTIFLIAFLIIAATVGVHGVLYGASLGVFLLFFALCGGMAASGLRLCGRAKRLRCYRQEIGASQFLPVSVLASAAGKTEKFVVQDLKRMMKLGLFRDAHFDEKETCLILDVETYRQYLHAQEEMERRRREEAEEERRRKENAELYRVIAEGENTIRQIRELNDRIPGEAVSRKISHLEEVTAKIFEHVSQHPEKLPEIRRFMSYYLPAVLKLLTAYAEFDVQPVQGENITAAKAEIVKALDTAAGAFERLLDSLFADAALDVSTDISVLETMLAQEGLTGSDFRVDAKQEER